VYNPPPFPLHGPHEETRGEHVIDLHTHTTASDGLLKPAELLARAAARGLTAIAITDHDTMSGVREALAGPIPPGLEVIPGIEVSSSIGDRELHVLGYFLDPSAPVLLAYEDERAHARTERLKRIIEQLNAAGIAVTLDEVLAQPGGDGAPGRPHVARVLIKKGYASGMGDCFSRILGKGGSGYVPYDKPDARAAAALIRTAGGVPVIAHAALDTLDPFLDELVAKGMAGIEVWHPDHRGDARDRYEDYAKRRGILVTGGSDFHGDGRKDGGALGGTTCPKEALEALRAAARGGRVPGGAA
jgi:predicted metal-dependent phosphoesterase TrpH